MKRKSTKYVRMIIWLIVFSFCFMIFSCGNRESTNSEDIPDGDSLAIDGLWEVTNLHPCSYSETMNMGWPATEVTDMVIKIERGKILVVVNGTSDQIIVKQLTLIDVNVYEGTFVNGDALNGTRLRLVLDAGARQIFLSRPIGYGYLNSRLANPRFADSLFFKSVHEAVKSQD